MKIINDSDLLEIIECSKKGTSAKNLLIDVAKKYPLLPAYGASIFTIGALKDNEVLTDLIRAGASTSLIYVFSCLICKITKKNHIESAKIDLQRLVNELAKLEVNTSFELLKEAKLNEVNYKMEYVDDSKLPKLKQYKYIDVPLSNGYEETLLQEHIIGDKDYEISVNSPVKKMNYKTAKNNA